MTLKVLDTRRFLYALEFKIQIDGGDAHWVTKCQYQNLLDRGYARTV